MSGSGAPRMAKLASPARYLPWRRLWEHGPSDLPGSFRGGLVPLNFGVERIHRLIERFGFAKRFPAGSQVEQAFPALWRMVTEQIRWAHRLVSAVVHPGQRRRQPTLDRNWTESPLPPQRCRDGDHYIPERGRSPGAWRSVRGERKSRKKFPAPAVEGSAPSLLWTASPHGIDGAMPSNPPHRNGISFGSCSRIAARKATGTNEPEVPGCSRRAASAKQPLWSAAGRSGRCVSAPEQTLGRARSG